MGFGKFLKKLSQPLTAPIRSAGKLVKGDVKGALKTGLEPLTMPVQATLDSSKQLLNGNVGGALRRLTPGVGGPSPSMPRPAPAVDPAAAAALQAFGQGPPTPPNPGMAVQGVGSPGQITPLDQPQMAQQPQPFGGPNLAAAGVALAGQQGGYGLKPQAPALGSGLAVPPPSVVGRGRRPRNAWGGGGGF
jgi:hypothetical protein